MEQNNRYLRIDSKIKYAIFLTIRFILFPFCRLMFGSKRKWLICERGDDAQDNGFVFYEYLVKNHREIKPVYLIRKESPDYQKVANIGKVVTFGSIKHFLMCIGCRVKISSNLYGYAPWIVMEKYFRRNKTRDIHVFLQHGISKNFHESFLAKNNKSLSLFVSGAFPEYNYLVSSYGYPNGVVKYTGLPRYDALHDCKSRQNILLIMPTWRSYLKGLSLEDFQTSEFYKKWIELLQDKNFIDTCSEAGFQIQFYLHHELQKYLPLFSGLKNISLISYADSTVQKLLIDSNILITDYSSVYFDFAYMHKNVLFYQFDEEEYYNGHYAKGYFDYRKANLGDVFVVKDDLIKKLKESTINNCELAKQRLRSIDYYFPIRDERNCERVFNSILDLMQSSKKQTN